MDADDRVVRLEGAHNFRDVGGYPTMDGRRVRRGLVYRSDKLSGLTAQDGVALDALGLRSVVDLRAIDEQRAEPSRWSRRPVDVYESANPSMRSALRGMLGELAEGDGARAAMLGFYRELPELFRVEYAALFHRLVAGEGPVLVHCTAGKDRTGVAVALLLSALGVPREVIAADYALTEALLPAPPRADPGAAAPVGGQGLAEVAMAHLPETARRAIWRADPAYLAAMFDTLDQTHGSIEGYLSVVLGLTAAELTRLRARLTQV